MRLRGGMRANPAQARESRRYLRNRLKWDLAFPSSASSNLSRRFVAACCPNSNQWVHETTRINSNPWLLLAVMCLGYLMEVLDTTVVNVVMPE